MKLTVGINNDGAFKQKFILEDYDSDSRINYLEIARIANFTNPLDMSKALEQKFGAQFDGFVIYFKTFNSCKEAIKWLESRMVMNTLSTQTS